MSLRVRIAAVFAALVGLNALLVVTLLWAYGVLVPGVVAGTVVFLRQGAVGFDFLRLPVSLPTVAVVVLGVLAVQAHYGYRRVLSGAAGDDRDDGPVTATVRRLAMAADVPPPSVRVVDDPTPSCYTVGRFTDATVVVTTGLVETLDAEELEAVLAHEVAHVANRDVTLMTLTTLFLEFADRGYHAARLVRRAIHDPEARSGRGAVVLQWLLPLALLTYVFVSPLLWLFATGADRATRALSHARELAADAAGARISGDPLALATALVTLSEATPTPEADLRTTRTRALCVVPGPIVTGPSGSLGAGAPEESGGPVVAANETNRSDDAGRNRSTDVGGSDRTNRSGWIDAWQARTPKPVESTGKAGATGTHPGVGERVRRLRRLAAETEVES